MKTRLTNLTGLLAGAALGTLLLVTPTAQAALTYTAVDTYLGSGDLANSSPDSEKAALAAILGIAVDKLTFQDKADTGTFFFNGLEDDLVNSSRTFYIDVTPDEPGYYALKFGVGNTDYDDTYFFENLVDLTKLVWRDSDVNFLTQCTDDADGNLVSCNFGTDTRLSHYTTFNGEDPDDPGEIPEPGSLALIGLGLAAAAFVRRRKVVKA